MGLIQLKLIQTSESVFADPTLPITRACIDGKVNVIYDTLDGYQFYYDYSPQDNVKLLDKVLGTCNFYFKRFFSKTLNSSLKNSNIYKPGSNIKLHNELYSELLHTKALSKGFVKLAVGHNCTLVSLLNQEYYKDYLFRNRYSLPRALRHERVSGGLHPGLLERVWLIFRRWIYRFFLQPINIS